MTKEVRIKNNDEECGDKVHARDDFGRDLCALCGTEAR